VKRFHLFLKVVAASIILATPAVIGAAVVEATGTVTLILTYLNSQGDCTVSVRRTRLDDRSIDQCAELGWRQRCGSSSPMRLAG
jgi:hypothetical protein